MYLTDGDLFFLFGMATWFVSLGICLISLCFRHFRDKKNALAWMVWMNLVAGVLFAAYFPMVDLQETVFEHADPGYTVSPLVSDIKSLYIPDLKPFEDAAYGCSVVNGGSSCEFPIKDRIASGRLHFIEAGRDPVVRFEIQHDEQECLKTPHIPSRYRAEERGPYPVAPELGVCVLGRAVAKITASHEFRVEQRSQNFPSRRNYLHVTLVDRSDRTIHARFDGWRDTSLYVVDEPIKKPRRPSGILGELIRIKSSRGGGYDRQEVENLLDRFGFNEQILMMAAKSKLQRFRARAIWLACREHISSQLSRQSKEDLREISKSIFSNSPDWVYPESCPSWAR